MRLAAAVLMLALPALAADPTPPRKSKNATPKRPWEALLESSRAALEASRGKREAVTPAAAATAPVAPVVSPSLDDAPDLVAHERRAIAPAEIAPAAPEAQVVPVLAEPPVQTSALAIAGLGNSPPPSTELDFNLLDQPDASPPAMADPLLEERLGMRRTMLTIHQTVGIGLLGLMTGTMVTGQLNYLDRFGGPSTARYQQSHQIFATATLATFGAAGLLAFFAPVPLPKESDGIDRVTLHKFGMIGATAGMVAEGTLGILTANHEGLADQSGLARAHLTIGYVTLLCMAVGVGALVF